MCASNKCKDSDGIKEYENKAKALGCSDCYFSVLEEETERERQRK
jgi:hypothetical protein